MSPPTIGVAARSRAGNAAARRAAARRRRAARRRARVLLGLGALAVAVAVLVLIPLVRKAVDELSTPLHYTDTIRQQAAEKHLDPALIAGVIYAETKFRPRDSSVGAVGPMQLMPQTAEFLARRSHATTFTLSDLNTPQVNIAYGSYYLRYLLNQYRGNVVLALAAYNGGESNVDHWVAKARAHRRTLTVHTIPFPETRAYVERVLKAQREYRSKYFSQLYG